MTKNEELTELLQGSMITVLARREEGKVELGFDNGAWITANTPPDTVVAGNIASGGAVEAVHQGEGKLCLELESGESVAINTAGASVAVAVVSSTEGGQTSPKARTTGGRIPTEPLSKVTQV